MEMTAARSIHVMTVDGDGGYENPDQQIDDASYEDVEDVARLTKKETDLQKILQSDIRLYKQVGVGLGLLCTVLALLNVAIPLYLHQSNMIEREQLQTSFDGLQNRHNNLTEQKDQLQRRFDQLQTGHDQVTEERDGMKRRLCESSGWQIFGRGLYYISTEEKNWDDSRQWCRERQSDLMIMKSREEQDFVRRLQKDVWVGLTDRELEGRFKWVDGTPLTTRYWRPGQPDNHEGNEDCVEFSEISASHHGHWNDGKCSDSRHWICQSDFSALC